MKSLKCMLVLTFILVTGLCAKAQRSETSARGLVHTDSLQDMACNLTARSRDAAEAERNRLIWNNRSQYINVGFVSSHLTSAQTAGIDWRSKLGFSIGYGKTYYLHRKPLARMIKFGIDWSMIDFTYAKYTSKSQLMFGFEMDHIHHQIDIGMQVGPSITVNPIGDLKISGYFRFAPSYSMLLIDDQFTNNYISYFVCGGAVSYKLISLGVESRWGKANYKGIPDSSDIWSTIVLPSGSEFIMNPSKRKLKTNSIRIYVSLRF